MAINATVLLKAAIEGGLVDMPTVEKLKIEARRARITLLDAVMNHGRFPQAALYQSLASWRGLDYAKPSDLSKIDPALVKRMPESILTRKAVLPLSEDNGEVSIVTADPDDRVTLDSVRRIFGRNIRLVISDPDVINSAIQELRPKRLGANDPSGATESTDFDPAEELDLIFKEAWLVRASDIHVEPHDIKTRVRLRVDGQLQYYRLSFDSAGGAALISRVKVLSGLDIAEQREPQDGGMSYKMPEPSKLEIDMRIATVPTRWGERMTIRILGQDTQDLTLDSIGMPKRVLSLFREAIAKPYGLILMTGPTGSGKTTTLYGALREINTPERNIMTAEDPVEYLMDGVSQIQVTGKISFAGALRSFLRHDPDVLMIGEIRDSETADVALKASMTGHLVFSTLHTNDSASAVSRLIDIGAERFLLASSLVGIVAQRLVRRLCQQCREARPATEEERNFLGLEMDNIEIYEPKGCPSCVGAGYRGRVGLYETLWIDAAVARVIIDGGTEQQIAEAASDYLTLKQDGCTKIIEGMTSISEIQRIVGGH